jgi:hypothetical protein
MGPGEDYKSNPAPPEEEHAPPATPLTEEEKEKAYKSLDPTDSPNVLVCINDDGSGAVQILEPAPPDAKPAPGPHDDPVSVEYINDKGSC